MLHVKKVADHVACLTFSRPSEMNKLCVRMGEEFEQAMAELAGDSSLRSLVICGEGKAFSAGGDFSFLQARRDASPAENKQEMLRFYGRFLGPVTQCPVPIVSALQGHAIGAGLCMSLATTARVARDDAIFSFNFSQIAIHPGMGASYFLPRLAGPGVAGDLLISGRRFNGLDAVRMGLCLESHQTADAVVGRAIELASEYAESSPHAVRQIVTTLRPDPAELKRALEREASAQAESYQTREFADWVAKF